MTFEELKKEVVNSNLSGKVERQILSVVDKVEEVEQNAGGGGGGNTLTPSVSNVGETSFDLSWALGSPDPAVNGYKVYVDGSENNSFGSSVSNTTVVGLNGGVSYVVEVFAIDSNNSNPKPTTGRFIVTTQAGN